jgi:hypothetical protein
LHSCRAQFVLQLPDLLLGLFQPGVRVLLKQLVMRLQLGEPAPVRDVQHQALSKQAGADGGWENPE